MIFLDFDGVIARCVHGASAVDRLIPDAVRRFDALVRRTRARVIVSSTWRTAGAGQVQAWLRAAGYSGTVDGVTPVLHPDHDPDLIERYRGAEIMAYRRARGYRGRYVVLDDLCLRGRVARRLVQVRGGALTDGDVELAESMLNK